MRVFGNRPFMRFAQRENITGAMLWEAINRAKSGLIDADLGGNLIKQRIARPGKGKSGGFRTIIAIHIKDRAFFIYGFAKNEQDNIRNDDLYALKLLATQLLKYDATELKAALEAGALTEIKK